MQQVYSSDMMAGLEEEAASHPGNIEAVRKLAEAYADLNRWNEALEKYRMAIRLDAGNVDLYNNIGVVYEEMGEIQEAKNAYHQAIALNPHDPMPYYNLGDLYEKQQRLPEAVHMYQKCLQLSETPDERAEVQDKITRLTSETATGQSRLAYRLAALVLFLGILLNILSLAISGDGTTILSSVIDAILAVGLLQFRPGARNFALLRAVLGALLLSVEAFLENDLITALVMSGMQWGYSGAILLLLTGRSTTWRLILAIALFAVFTLGVLVVLLMLLFVAQMFGGV